MEPAISLRIVLDIALAMLLGGIIGFEREMKLRPAGFRTHMLVAGASALIVGIGQLVASDARFEGIQGSKADPLRLVEAVVAGVSFIGAGTIFASRHATGISGITTAASLLIVAATGLAVGFGYYAVACGTTLLALLVLTLLQWFDRRAQRAAEPGPESAATDADSAGHKDEGTQE